MKEHDRWSRYIKLRDRVLDKCADGAELKEFEQIVLRDEAAKRDFVEHLHQESALLTLEGLQAEPARTEIDSSIRTGSQELRFVPPRYRLGYVAIAACVLLLTAAGILSLAHQRSVCLATMGSTRDCQWGASDMSTMPGATLTRGRLMLVSGIATLKFPLVDVTLEGPVDFELVGEACCRVRSGRVYTEVYPGGEGFVVETPTAILVDRGTIFGVSVSHDGTSDIDVIQGIVDAKHLASGKMISVTTSTPLRMSESTVEHLLDLPLSPSSQASEIVDVETNRSVQLTTAVGDGRDAYVIAGMERPSTKDVGAVLVKESNVDSGAWRRRAYLHFDLSLLPQGNIRAAKLQLRGAPTDLGYLAATPDTTFAVYGLTDESAEAWDENRIDWQTCPGATSNRIQLDPNKTSRLGTFAVSSSDPEGVFSIESEQLVEFLLSDSNGGATIIVVSETSGIGESYVHGFASKRHSSLSPPTLRVDFSE